jgi:hypothetical protein
MGGHERISDGWDIVIVVLVLDQDRLAQEIPERDAKGTGEVGEDVDAADLALAAFDLAQPVLRPPHEAGEDHLGQTPALPVERNAFPDA